jgi:hypothetical protein
MPGQLRCHLTLKAHTLSCRSGCSFSVIMGDQTRSMGSLGEAEVDATKESLTVGLVHSQMSTQAVKEPQITDL